MTPSRADRAVVVAGGAVEGAVRALARGVGWVVAVAVAAVVLALITVGSKAERLISWGEGR